MSLNKEEYNALEDVVGPEYISQDPAIRETYNQTWGNMYLFDGKWSNRPGAIVLPGSTKDVQGIVRVCNRYGIMFKPIANGWEHVCLALTSEHSIILDMRRMNHILEIDTKNMHAVVEPYVCIYQLTIEAAKYGLLTHGPSAGPSAAVIQFCCAHNGNSRNTLGVEWVLPTGDILRMGSAEAGNGWFSAEGPGLDMRGIQRGGKVGANGGNGVFTKVCTKLYPWYGPPEWELVGSPPGVKEFKTVPEGYKILIVTFQDADEAYNAGRDITMAEIAHRVGPEGSGRGQTFGETARDEWETLTKIFTSEEYKVQAMSMRIILGAASNREMEFREKCALEICRRHGGNFNPELSQPERTARELTSTFGVMGPKLRGYEHFAQTVGVDDSPDYCGKMAKLYNERLEPYTKRGLQVGFSMRPPANIASVHFMMNRGEYGSIGSGTMFTFNVDPYNEESLKSYHEVCDDALNPDGKMKGKGFPFMHGGFNWEPNNHLHENFGPVFENYDVWMRGIKKVLDPNNVNDWGAYIPPEYVKVEKGKEGLGERTNNPKEW